nr:protein CURVATURE THYLAKOID 1C, chloroplastic [Ipomoea batatas]
MGRAESSLPSLIFIDSCYSSISEKPVRSTIAAKATSEGSESSTSISFKSIRNVWDKSEDRIALIGLGFAGIVGVWAAINLVAAIDKLPIVPSTLEFIGILFSSLWDGLIKS